MSKSNGAGAVQVDEFVESDPALKKALEDVAATGDLVIDAPKPDVATDEGAQADVPPVDPPKPDADPKGDLPPDPKPGEPVDWKARAEKTEARIAELTKKLNDRDGAHGTELAQIRQQNLLLQAELERARAQREEAAPAASGTQGDEPDFAAVAKARLAKLPKKFKDQFASEQELLERLEWDIAQEYAINGTLRDGSPASSVKPDDIRKIVSESMNTMNWYGKVESKAPGFIEANGDETRAPGDPGWVEHLKQPVFPGSKMTLAEALSTASEDAVADQFNLYKKGSAAEPAANADPNAGVKPNAARRPTLAQLASSRAGAGATTTTQPGKKTFTQAQVDELERKAGVPGARPEDRRAFEEAMEAYLAGRVVG